MPVCTQPGEAGCVVAFSTFAEDPPEGSRFGVAQEDRVFGLPGGPGFEVVCTDPGPLSGIDGPVGVTVPTEPFAPGLIAGGIVITYGGPPPIATTTWVRPADRFAGSCQTINGAHVLRYEPVGLDVNYGLERQVAIVASQVRTCAGGPGGGALVPARAVLLLGAATAARRLRSG